VTTTVIALVVALVVLLLVMVSLLVGYRRLRQSVRGTLERIGYPAPTRRLRSDLDAAVSGFGRAVAGVERERSQLVGALGGTEVGITVVDDSGTVVFANEAARRFVGARHGEAVAEVRVREMLDDVIVRRVSLERDIDLYSPVRRVLQLRVLPLEHGIETVGAVAYVQDLTEARRIDAVRRDFVANVGHELKTPLGALAVLAETLADTDDPELRARLANRLGREAQRLAHLVDDILDLSQVEAWAAPREPVAVSAIVDEALAQVALAAEERNVPLDVTRPGPEVLVSGDRRQLTSAVANLLENAVKYTAVKFEGATPPDAAVRMRVDVAGERVRIAVSDRGIGIPELHLQRVFERFYRVDPARSRETGGTGLGLSIVRHVAANHGGSVAVESKEGEGTVFTLEVPVWRE
jgi:two-component system sensor histidine kinase SenX3